MLERLLDEFSVGKLVLQRLKDSFIVNTNLPIPNLAQRPGDNAPKPTKHCSAGRFRFVRIRQIGYRRNGVTNECFKDVGENTADTA